MAKEIERKFIVTGDGWKSAVQDRSRFQQAYIASSDDRSVRVRILDEKHARLTIKLGRTALVRDEFEYDIPLDDAKALLASALGIVIEKTRHRVPFEGFVWEVDVFGGHYEGLVMAEVEMQSSDERPKLPPWLGREVTGDHRYSNQSLATATEQGLHVLPHTA